MGKRSNEEREEGEVEDDSDEEFNDGYDENLMGDEDDKRKLSEMNEKERELELFNRSEKREVLKTRFEIEKKLKRQKLNEKRRSSSGKSKLKNAIKDLKEIREKKKKNQQRLRAIDIYSDSSSSSSSSSDDEDEEVKKKAESRKSPSSSSSDSEKSEKEDIKSESEDETQEHEDPVTLADLNTARISRFKVEKWIHDPFLNDVLTGSFVKIASAAKSYKIGQVDEVIESQVVYKLTNGKKTNKVMKVKFGGDIKQFKFEFLSNSEFTEDEFNDWKQRMDKDRCDMITKKFCEKKAAEIDKANNYQITEKDIEEMLNEKKKYNSVPYNFAVRKTELKKKKEEAEQMNDLVEVDRLARELEDLEDQAKKLDQKRTSTIQAISYINERNRMRNIIEAEKAIIEERKKEKEQGDDPFRRRKCAPILVHKFGKNETKEGDQIDGVTIKNEEGDKNNTEQLKSGKGGSLTATSQSPFSVDLFSAHDFEIEIDFNTDGGLPPPKSVEKISTNRRSLNLEDYKKKKGLI